MRAHRRLEHCHAATELPARTCGKLQFRRSAPERRTVTRSLAGRSALREAEHRHGVMERGASFEAWAECTTVATRVVPPSRSGLLLVRRQPNASAVQLRAKCPRIPNSTVRCPPPADSAGRSPGRAAPGSCNRWLGRARRVKLVVEAVDRGERDCGGLSSHLRQQQAGRPVHALIAPRSKGLLLDAIL